ncbi:MAG: DsbA family oxidoreductase [Ferruginibacter sp.]|nr:DsbA family oxidoreductase [Cytophagales bacterium]
MNKPTLKIDIISDVVCPWCYIGKRRLEKALDQLSDRFDFELQYHPFELNPTLPPEGTDQPQYLIRKFGGQARYEPIIRHVTALAAAEGLAFHFEKQFIAPNTRNAHRLIGLAHQQGRQLPLVELLFRAYFTDGVDLSKKENLVALAAQAGLDPERAEKLLAGEEGLREVVLAEKELQQMGITGVPFYIIDHRHGVSGAQAPEAFIEAIERIGSPVVPGGEACDVDGRNC